MAANFLHLFQTCIVNGRENKMNFIPCPSVALILNDLHVSRHASVRGSHGPLGEMKDTFVI